MAGEKVSRLFGDRGEAEVWEDPASNDGFQEARPLVDHYVYVDGRCEAILLGSRYPDELSRERARRAFQKANLGKRVELRSRSRKERKE